MAKVKNEVENNEINGMVVAEESTTIVSPFSNNLMAEMDLGSFYSIAPKTDDEKIMVFNAINNPDKRLADMINMTINVKDVLVDIVELESEQTGQLERAPRIVLLDDKNVSYACVSVGIFSALKKIMKLFGQPTWEKPIKIMVKQLTIKEKKMLTLELVK